MTFTSKALTLLPGNGLVVECAAISKPDGSVECFHDGDILQVSRPNGARFQVQIQAVDMSLGNPGFPNSGTLWLTKTGPEIKMGDALEVVERIENG